MKELFGGRYSSGIFPATNQNQRSKSASTQKNRNTDDHADATMNKEIEK
jgi:hypothetical protein